MSRAERRKNTWKHIQRQKKIYESSGRIVDDPHYFHKKSCWSCGCAMCGNPRRYFGEKTVQERRVDEDDIHQMIDEYEKPDYEK